MLSSCDIKTRLRKRNTIVPPTRPLTTARPSPVTNQTPEKRVSR
jgi:hypothetical protein